MKIPHSTLEEQDAAGKADHGDRGHSTEKESQSIFPSGGDPAPVGASPFRPDLPGKVADWSPFGGPPNRQVEILLKFSAIQRRDDRIAVSFLKSVVRLFSAEVPSFWDRLPTSGNTRFQGSGFEPLNLL